MLTPHVPHVTEHQVPLASTNETRRIERVFMYAFHQQGDTKHHTWNDCPDGKLIPGSRQERGECGLPQCEKCFLAVEAHHRYLDGISPWFEPRKLQMSKAARSNLVLGPVLIPCLIPELCATLLVPVPPPSPWPPLLASWFSKGPGARHNHAPRVTESFSKSLEEISGSCACL